MSDLEGRLKSWFAGEVSRAERELASSKVRTARVRRRRPIPGLALAGLLVALVVVALALRPIIVSPNSGKGPVRSPTGTPTSGTHTVFGADGLPTTIDGEPVLRVPEAQSRLAASSSTRLLVGGWYSLLMMRCAFAKDPPTSPLLPYCNPSRLSADPEHVQAGLSVVPDSVPTSVGWVVLRVHTGDPRAFSCSASIRAQCEKAIVVDEVVWQNPLPADPMAGRYLDGIPGDIDGEAVIRPQDLAGTELIGDATFLLGGWHGQDRWFGCGRLGETHPLLDDCSPEWIAEAPGGPGEILMLAREIPEGPVVIRVHTDDPRSATCPELERIRCAERLVVDELVWAGDAVTSAEPLRIDDVVMAMRQDIASFTVEVDRPSRACDPGWPDIPWISTSGSGVTNILVFPTIADREAVDQNFRSSGWTRLDGCSVYTYGDPWHWVSVENVMVSTSEALAERTRARLEAIAP
jgi:hypothetical protein